MISSNPDPSPWSHPCFFVFLYAVSGIQYTTDYYVGCVSSGKRSVMHRSGVCPSRQSVCPVFHLALMQRA